MALTELRTPRLLLRAWRDSDREPFAAINADPRVMRWFPSTQDRARSDEGVDRFQALHAELGYTGWAVEVLGSDRGPAPLVGFVGLVPPAWPAPFGHVEPFVEIGWRLSADWWGLGIATEAAREALRFGFEEAGLTEVVSFTVPPNLPSQAVMQRIGMRYDGVFHHPKAAAGDWWGPHVLYRVDVEAARAAGDPSGRTHP
jgi:RimJ/RimL family protein N-acetyltransferase